MKSLFQNRSVRILSLILLAQAGVFYGFSRREMVPAHKPLQDFTWSSHAWAKVQDVELDKDTLDVLQADDILSRIYQNATNGQTANLFVAYFSTQRTGKTPHSPKNCLPASGWVPSESGTTQISIPSLGRTINVNRYIVARGQNQSVVMYWYQSRQRVMANEYSAKIYTVTDSIRYNRSDTALVRAVVLVRNGDVQQATATAASFVESFFAPLQQYLPS